MPLEFLGVDVAGSANTWVASLSLSEGRPKVALTPGRMTLAQIREYCDTNDVLAVAIDAQLTLALEHENGFRPADLRLRELLPAHCRNWVASASSLMAVPLRGKMLAEELTPLVGTVLETHPRACLRAVLGDELHGCIDSYKDRGSPGVATLASAWRERFLIEGAGQVRCDGELDSLVCATVALTYHRKPEQLQHLRSPDCQLRGSGPFYTFSFT